MKKLYFLFVAVLVTSLSFGQNPIITAISDGDCSGGTPKMLEIYADGTVDFSLYSMERQSNGGAWGTTTNLAALGTVTDAFVYIYNDSSSPEVFATEYPSATTAIEDGVVNVNGDDGLRIILDSDSSVVDQYGVDGEDASGFAWEYADGFAKRVDGTGPDGGFVLANWTFSNGALNGGGTCQGGDTFETLMGGIGTYSTTASTTPTINVNGSVNNLFYFEGNGPSSEDSFSVSGINLTTDITVTVPSDFEISLTTGGPYTSSVMVTQTAGTAPITDVFVRLVAGLPAASYMGDATATSTTAADATLALTGTVSPADPLINTFGSITDLEYSVGNGPSADDSFGVSALFLGADLIITAPANFEISLTTGTGFTNAITLTPDGAGAVPTTDIFVRLVAGLAEGNYMGDVTVTSTGATDRTEAANGNVTPNATCAPAGSIIITEVMQNPAAAGDPAGEYFELYNTTAGAIDLQGWVIKDETSVGETHTITASVIVPAGGYIVIANAATTAPVADYSYANDISLGNGTDGVIIECGGNTIDQVIWDNGATFPDPSGSSMELSVTTLNATDNDDGVNWGTATTDLGNGDNGTPGAANDFSLSTDNFETTNFSLYPNPTHTGFVTISSSNNDAITVEVFDILGKQVKNETLTANTLNVSNLNTGIYIIKITQNNASTTKKLVIK